MKKRIRRSLVTTLRKGQKLAWRSPVLKKRIKAVVYGAFPQLMGRTGYLFDKHWPTINEYAQQLQASQQFRHRPLISVVLPTYNTPERFLRECIDSVLVQSYPNWQLCICDDASTEPHVEKILKEYAKKDPRIVFVLSKKNSHISEATNRAIDLATGEYIGLLDHDDILWPNALFETVKLINGAPEADLIYSDEDKIDQSGEVHSYPLFKPDWSPEFLESCNYITHFACIRSSLLRAVGGLRKGLEGAQDWDLFLRVSEKTDHIYHIPKLLYSWRVHGGSTAYDTETKPYVFKAQLKTLEDHLARLNRKGTAEIGIIKQHRILKYELKKNPSLLVLSWGEDRGSVSNLEHALRQSGVRHARAVLFTSNRSLRAKGAISIHELRGEPLGLALNKLLERSEEDFVAMVDGSSKIETRDWAKLLIADAQWDEIGLVGGEMMSGRNEISAAGATMTTGGVAPLLNGVSTANLDGTQTLYANSRRTVLLHGGGVVVGKRSDILTIGGVDPTTTAQLIPDVCLSLRAIGKRQVYNPLVRVVCDYPGSASALAEKWGDRFNADPFYNPNLNLDPPNFELKHA